MPFYDNEKPRPDSPKIVRPFNVLSVDGDCSQFTGLLLNRLRQEYPKLLRDTDLLIGGLPILALAVSESLSLDISTADVLLTEKFRDLQFGDLSKRVVITNERRNPGQLFSTFRNPETSLADVFAETSEHFIENNPSVLGLSYAVDPIFGKAFFDEVHVLSVGLTEHGSIDLIQYQCEQLLDKQFHRVGPGADFTDTEENLILAMQKYDLSPAISWLKEYWK